MAPDVATLRILHYPAPVLRQRAEEVPEITDSVRAVAARMIELMHEADGVGLAAPQVGLPWRLFVANSREEGDADRTYVNPRLVRLDGDLVAAEEGCLSLPGIRAQVRRPESAVIVATDLDGREFQVESASLLARVWQHEYDHLDGVLILDKMSPLDRIATRRAVKELVAAAGR